MLRIALLATLATFCVIEGARAQTVPAQAQSSYQATTGPGQAPQLVPGVVALCPGTNGTAIPCPAASSTPGASAVRANDTSTTSRDQTHDDSLVAVLNAGKLAEYNPLSTTTTLAAIAGTAVSTSSVTLVAATTTPRMRAVLYNTGTAAAWCRADGGTPAVATGVSLPAGGGGYQWNYPSAGTGAINCICASASACTLSGEYVQ